MTRFFSKVESESECSSKSMNTFSSNVVRGCIMNLGSNASFDVFVRGGGGGGIGGFQVEPTIS